MQEQLYAILWELRKIRENRLLMLGLKTKNISFYDDELIAKLRTMYYGGIPLSIILLSDGMSLGNCSDKTLLLARAFLDSDDDLKLIYATIDSLKLNPDNKYKNTPFYSERCFLQRKTKNGKCYIYDTFMGIRYDKSWFYTIENPKIRTTNGKDAIERLTIYNETYEEDDLEIEAFENPKISTPNNYQLSSNARGMIHSIKQDQLHREINHYHNDIAKLQLKNK